MGNGKAIAESDEEDPNPDLERIRRRPMRPGGRIPSGPLRPRSAVGACSDNRAERPGSGQQNDIQVDR